MVARSREWIAVVGLPAPLPSVLRAPIAGARLAAASDRSCPKLPAGTQLLAAAAGPADELVLVTAGRPGPGDAGPAADLVTYYSNAGRPLLALDSGLRGIRAAAFGRDDGRLWVVAEEPAPGLWRLDAAFVDGRQTIRGSHVARFATAAGLVSIADRAIAALTATPGMRLVRLDLDTTEKPGP